MLPIASGVCGWTCNSIWNIIWTFFRNEAWKIVFLRYLLFFFYVPRFRFWEDADDPWEVWLGERRVWNTWLWVETMKSSGFWDTSTKTYRSVGVSMDESEVFSCTTLHLRKGRGGWLSTCTKASRCATCMGIKASGCPSTIWGWGVLTSNSPRGPCSRAVLRWTAAWWLSLVPDIGPSLGVQ